MEVNEQDIELFYDLLGHEKETEIRVFKGPERSFFVTNKNDFVNKVKELNLKGLDVYAGVNERSHKGTKDIHVTHLGLFFIDMDAHSKEEDIKDIKKKILNLYKEFSIAKIESSVDSSGRGYHLLIPFDRIKIDDSNFESIKSKISQFKGFLVDKYGADKSTFDLSRVCRVTGTINHNNNSLSYFEKYNERSDNKVLFEFINNLPEEKKEIVNGKAISSIEKNRYCKFFEDKGLNEKFPQGSRHITLAKNLAVYCANNNRDKLIERFSNFQGMTNVDFAGWNTKISNGDLSEFNCGEVINYCHENKISSPCTLCPYNNFKFNEKTVSFSNFVGKEKLVVEKLIYQHKKIKIGKYNNMKTGFLYHIYKVCTAIGNEPKYLIVQNQKDVREGDFEHFVSPLRDDKEFYEFFVDNSPKKQICRKMLKELEYTVKEINASDDHFQSLVDEDSSHLDGLFLCLSYGIDKNEVLSLNNEDCKKIIEDFVTLGLSMDEKIKFSFNADFFVPSIEETDLSVYQYYNAHKLLFTDTKAGKTSVSNRVGHNSPRSSVSNLLGFSTSEEIIRGTLDNNIMPYYIDELQEDDSKAVYGKMLNFMEFGKVNIDVGRKSIACNGFSSLTFLGNPKSGGDIEETEFVIAEQFNNTINLITNNYVALGSRFGFVLFDPKTKRISGESKYQGEDFIILNAKYDLLRKLTSEKFSLFLKEKKVLNFMNRPYNNKYNDLVKNISDQTNIQSIKEFLIGHRDSFRHANGMAVRLALTDFLKDIINDMLDMDLVLEKSKYYLEEIKKTNLDSFRILVSNENVKNFFIEHYKKEFEIGSVFDKIMLESIYKYWNDNDRKGSHIKVSDIIDYIRNSPMKEDNRSVSIILDKFNKKKLSYVYKIDYNELDTVQYFTLRDPMILDYIFTDSKSKKGQLKL